MGSENKTVTTHPPTTPIVVATIGKYETTVGKTVKKMDIPPVIIDNRTLAPARFVAEALGCDVAWDAANRSVLITTKPGVIEPDTPTPEPVPELVEMKSLPIEIKEAGGKTWYFTLYKKKIEEVDDNYKYIVNKNYLVKTDYNDNVIESCKYTDIDLIDGEELYNSKIQRLFIGSNGEVVFYDLEVGSFRKISKN